MTRRVLPLREAVSTLRRLLLYLFLACFLVPIPGYAAATPESFAPLAEKLSPTVVNIFTTQKIKGSPSPFDFPMSPGGEDEQLRDFFERFGFGMPPGGEPMEQEVQSLGSGFVIDPKGYVVTNNHVIEQAEEIEVRFQDNTHFSATVIGRDTKTDLALLKIEASHPLPYVTLGDSDKVRVGDWVLAIGNPYGLGGTVTAGIISARSRNINAGPFDDFLQTDAAINRGNSGGPMFNIDGEVIGVNTAIFSPTGGSVGIGFAIPTALAKPVLDQLREFGRTHRGWLGVRIQEVTEEIADSVGLDKPKGALVLEITKGSPAEKASLKPGDIIYEFNGMEITEMRFLPRMVAETRIGTKADITVWRDERPKKLTVLLGELEEKPDEVAGEVKPGKPVTPEGGEDVMGMALKSLSAALREQYDIDRDVDGVLVLDVERGGVAASQGIRAGDVIVSVNQEEVGAVREIRSRFADARKNNRKHALIRIWRKGEFVYLTLPLEEKK